jgi:hypothetical protein
MKKYRLNLMHEDTKDLVPFIWNMSFSEACNHVKTQAHLQVITSVGTAKHKLRGGSSVNSAKADAYDELMEAFASREAAVAARDLPSDMVLSPELFQCIPPNARAKFQQKQAALAKRKQGEMTQGQATDNKERDQRGLTPLPRQYEVQKKSANHAGQDSNDDNLSALSDSKEDDIRPPSLPAYNQTAMANIARALEDLALDDVERQANLIVVDNDDSEDESLTTDDDKQSLSSALTNPSIANARVVNMAATVRTGRRDVHIEERLGMNM